MDSSDISIISKKMESMSMNRRVVRLNKRLTQFKYSPYTKETNLTNYEKQKEEAVRLGVELSLFVAEAMFLLSDDKRSVLLLDPLLLTYSEFKNTNDRPVVGRVICVMRYVFETYIKPKNGVYKPGGKSNQWGLILKSRQNFTFGIKELNRIVLVLRNRESSFGGVVKPSEFEQYKQEMKKLEETLRSSKDVSEANGFAREEIKSNILHLWKSLFDPKITFNDMCRSILNQSWDDVCSSLIASLHM